MLVNLCTFCKLKCGLISTAKNRLQKKIISKLYTMVLQFGIKMQQFAPAKINPVIIHTVLISCMADNVVIYL